MALWYCYINGKQYGPVNEDEFRTWIAEGRIRPENYVWCEGLADWVPLSSLSQFTDTQATSTPYSDIPPAPGGTNGQTPNAELTRHARVLLHGRLGQAVAFCLLLGLLQVAISTVPYVGGIISLVLTGPIALGQAIYFLCLSRYGKPQLGMIFHGFRNFGNAMAAYLLILIFTVLWSLLFVIPGIIAAISYSQAYYILANDRNVDALEAIRRSKNMMYGHKWKYFCMGLRFLFWALLTAAPVVLIWVYVLYNNDMLFLDPDNEWLIYGLNILTSFLFILVGCLWYLPYLNTSLARFHDDLHGRATAAAVSATVTVDPMQITPARTEPQSRDDDSGPTDDTFGSDLIDRS